MAKEIGFHFGALADPLEKQANQQGFTLGEHAEFCEEVTFGVVAGHIHGLITDGEYNRILLRLIKYLAKKVKPLKDGGKENGDS